MVEFGDFQTPDLLAGAVCNVLGRLGVSPRSVVEPTCGRGSFLRASVTAFPESEVLLGFEINPDYAQAAKAVPRARVQRADFFEKNWPETLNGIREPILVIGNPPWVTNAAVGALDGENLPVKTNFHRLSGLDALTGKSNFDISEWMLLHLLECLSGREAILAMLCKTAVARKVLRSAWDRNLQIRVAAMHLIDADEHFGAAVDACLLVCILEPGATSRECAIYPELETLTATSTLAYRDGRLVADLGAFDAYRHLGGNSPLKWRSGVKHDCARVMELRPKGDETFQNGLGEVVSLEPSHLYPMLKSSDLTRPRLRPSRYMLVTQRAVGEDTSRIQSEAPRTWEYLRLHSDHLDGRSSSIYRNRPRFSVFGVGPYTFAPWKVAVSGFYKRLDFRCVGPVDNKPVVLDDTCYFLSCETERDAVTISGLLNSESARGFFRSRIFWDAKRPITAEVLRSLDIARLAEEAGVALPGRSDAPHNIPLFRA